MTPFDKLIAILTVSFTDKELESALASLQRMDQREMIGLVREFRRMLKSYTPEMRRYYSGHRFVVEVPPSRAAREVERLLRRDLGMPVGVAARHLLEQMEQSGDLEPGMVKLPVKEAFGRWVEKLARFSSPSAILHHATSIRNMYAHTGESDWPLKGSE